MKKFQTVSVGDMPGLLAAENSLLLDCRQVHDYRAGHIENAMHAHDELVESLIRKADKDTNLVIYCYHGHSSEHLAELFGNFGFQNVFSVQGGYASWLESQGRQ